MARVKTTDVQEAVSTCVEELSRCGLEAIVVDLTTPEIAELGFQVVKVFAPGLVNLTSEHRVPPTVHGRSKDVPDALRATHRSNDALNEIPHPFS